ncbi:hypothetical protein F2P81_015701 [Scophthalmus maximus]|uniref:Ig-like domain-containing protein n=1 Tax=Scophthalmus maximus TaxID=52904 RepID=A0A6A4S7G5_SCOMX|nr:hypothetical protein F2P81_015701 [Scophthalmus maximus]
MQVTSTGPQTIQRAEGESVTLGCSYAPSPVDAGELDIEWSVVSPDTTRKDRMLMSYTGGTQYVHADRALAKGLRFAAADPSRGDASLTIAALSPAHGATYQCKVKKNPGVDARKLSLVVMDSVTGELKISNHSQSLAGVYLCEVNNAVGAQRCRINLKAIKPPNRAAVIVGTAVGSLLLIVILLVFIGLLYWKMSSRFRHEKEFSNEIREDVPPPESRPASRHTCRSAGHQPQVTYCGLDDGSSFSDAPTHPPRSSTPVKCTSAGYDGSELILMVRTDGRTDGRHGSQPADVEVQ